MLINRTTLANNHYYTKDCPAAVVHDTVFDKLAILFLY
ncbi:hypothetical protein JM48_2705 [Lactiplantibacillus plantarum]|nr:hypothetical protein JM48_2705 [Lactiplantibacillus plantarum]